MISDAMVKKLEGVLTDIGKNPGSILEQIEGTIMAFLLLRDDFDDEQVNRAMNEKVIQVILSSYDRAVAAGDTQYVQSLTKAVVEAAERIKEAQEE